jgi:hypothetical protein
MMTPLEQRVHDAVVSNDVDGLRALRDLIRCTAGSGVDLDLITQALTHVYDDCLRAGDESAADLALDGLDLLTGWASPGTKIRPRTSA